MNRNLLYIAVPALIASVSLGCAKPTVVGKWQGTVPIPGQGTAVPATVDYKADGTMEQVMTTPVGPITVTGTYKVDGDTLTTTGKDIKLNGNALPPMLAARVPASAMTNSATFKLDGDNLNMSSGGKDIAFTRVKEEAAK